MKRYQVTIILLSILLFVSSCQDTNKSTSEESTVQLSEETIESKITETSLTETTVAQTDESSSTSLSEADYDRLYEMAENMYEIADGCIFAFKDASDKPIEFTANDPYAFWSCMHKYCNEHKAFDKVGTDAERTAAFWYSADEISSYAQAMFYDFEVIPKIPDDIQSVYEEDDGYVILFGNYADISTELRDIEINEDGSILLSINEYIYVFNPDYQAVLYSINTYCLIEDADENNSFGLTIQEGWQDIVYDPSDIVEPSPTPLPPEQREYNSWQEAYIDYVDNIPEEETPMGYCLIYLDDNEVPELFVQGICEAVGEKVITFYDNHLVIQHLSRIGSYYIEHDGLICNNCGHMDYYPVYIYVLENGSFSLLAEGLSGWISNDYNPVFDENGQPLYEYFWQGNPVNNEDEYYQKINEVFDVASGTRPSVWYSRDDILSIINSFSPPEVANQ